MIVPVNEGQIKVYHLEKTLVQSCKTKSLILAVIRDMCKTDIDKKSIMDLMFGLKKDSCSELENCCGGF